MLSVDEVDPVNKSVNKEVWPVDDADGCDDFIEVSLVFRLLSW